MSAPIAERRARLVIRCACDLLGVAVGDVTGPILLPLSVTEFENELRARFGAEHPDLVFRTDSTLERARLDRRTLPGLPRVILRQGAPRRSPGGDGRGRS